MKEIRVRQKRNMESRAGKIFKTTRALFPM
jgi:hypothetical protein